MTPSGVFFNKILGVWNCDKNCLQYLDIVLNIAKISLKALKEGVLL